MVLVVGAVGDAVGGDQQPMGASEDPFTPGAQKIPIRRKDQHRMLSPGEEVDPALCVTGPGGDAAERPAPGQAAPVMDHLINEIAAADPHR